MFELELFRKQIYCIEENTCDSFGTFRRPYNDSAPHVDSAPGELRPPFPPRYAPGLTEVNCPNSSIPFLKVSD